MCLVPNLLDLVHETQDLFLADSSLLRLRLAFSHYLIVRLFASALLKNRSEKLEVLGLVD